MAEEKLTIGMADVTIDGVKVGRQADAAVLSFEPQVEDIDLYLITAYDKMLTGWNVTLTLSVDEETYEHYKMALANVQETSEGGLTDGKSMTRLRKNAVEVVVHPNDMGESKEFDVTLFKAVPTGTVERTYGKEVAGYEITYQALHRTGDPSTIGNYFLIGESATQSED